MQLVIDRFEENLAVVELPDGTTAKMDRRILVEFSEGDVLMLKKDDTQTDQRKDSAKKALSQLFDA